MNSLGNSGLGPYPYLCLVKDKKFADISEHRMECLGKDNLWERQTHIICHRKIAYKSKKLADFISANLNENTKGLLVKFSGDNRSGGMANASDNSISI